MLPGQMGIISIHAPRVGSDCSGGRHRKSRSNFNPRSPCGERLFRLSRLLRRFPFQSTLPVWGATTGEIKLPSDAVISIHAPRVGSDLSQTVIDNALPGISIHAPRVGSDDGSILGISYRNISIHAPRVGSDGSSLSSRSRGRNFNPRSPCGERPSLLRVSTTPFRFQSTLPVWGATTGLPFRTGPQVYFNPRSPCGERQVDSRSDNRQP